MALLWQLVKQLCLFVHLFGWMPFLTSPVIRDNGRNRIYALFLWQKVFRWLELNGIFWCWFFCWIVVFV